jgi:hypothetical protein
MSRGWATMGTRAVAIGLALLLVVVAAAPVEAQWRAGFWLGLGAGTLLTAPFWGPYGYSSPYYSPYYPPYYSPYSYPSYQPYPIYGYPPAATPATPMTPTPSPLTPPPPTAGEGAIARKCGTVWVEGHYETHVGPTGQASLMWLPGVSRPICE